MIVLLLGVSFELVNLIIFLFYGSVFVIFWVLYFLRFLFLDG